MYIFKRQPTCISLYVEDTKSKTLQTEKQITIHIPVQCDAIQAQLEQKISRYEYMNNLCLPLTRGCNNTDSHHLTQSTNLTTTTKSLVQNKQTQSTLKKQSVSASKHTHDQELSLHECKIFSSPSFEQAAKISLRKTSDKKNKCTINSHLKRENTIFLFIVRFFP